MTLSAPRVLKCHLEKLEHAFVSRETEGERGNGSERIFLFFRCLQARNKLVCQALRCSVKNLKESLANLVEKHDRSVPMGSIG